MGSGREYKWGKDKLGGFWWLLRGRGKAAAVLRAKIEK